jgi:AraC-like DNA-binding protein
MADERLIKPTIPAQYIVELFDGARFKGMDVNVLLRKAGVNPEILKNTQARFSIQIYYHIMRTVRDALQDEFLGFLQKKTPPKAFGVFCQGVTGLPDLYSVIQYANQFYHLFTDEFYWTLERDDKSRITRFNIQLKLDPNLNPKFLIEILLLNPYKLCSWLIGEQIPIQSAHFSFSKPDFFEQHHYLFGNNIFYGSDRNGLDFDLTTMSQPVIREQKDVPSFLKAWSSFLYLNPYTYPFTRRVRQKLLSEGLENGFPVFQQMAISLNISHQNLWYKLNREGTSYQRIKDQLRHDLAIHFLGKTKLSITEVALKVGYADERHFYRMFKKWTGMSPGAYRQLLGS